MLNLWDEVKEVEDKEKEDSIVTEWDKLHAEFKKRLDYYAVMLHIGNTHKTALDAIRTVRGANKPNAKGTDYGEIINSYKTATDAFIAADPHGQYPFPWVTPIKEIGFMVDDIVNAFENSERSEAKLLNSLRTRDDWAKIEADCASDTYHTVEEFEKAMEKLHKLRRICRKVKKREKRLNLTHEQIERLLDRIPLFGGFKVTLNNYKMIGGSIGKRKLKKGERLLVCECWDCNNIYPQRHGHQKYCGKRCVDEQEAANDRFKRKWTYVPKEIYLPIREKERETKWKKLTASLTDELASMIDDKGQFQNGGKRKPVNVKASIDANVKYYEAENKKEPIPPYILPDFELKELRQKLEEQEREYMRLRPQEHEIIRRKVQKKGAF